MRAFWKTVTLMPRSFGNARAAPHPPAGTFSP
jgi:hypothetical protein